MAVYVANASNLLSLLLLIFGTNDMPPKEPHIKRGGKCPVVESQEAFELKHIMRKTFYVNYASTDNTEPKRFKCITLAIENRADGHYLRLVGIRADDGKRERAWHKLIDDKKGHYEIDLRVNDDQQEGKAYLYYDVNNPARELHIYVCIRFLKPRKHAEGIIIATENQIVSPIPLATHIEQLKESTNAEWNSKGLRIRNDCPLKEDNAVTVDPLPDQPEITG